MLNPNYEVVVGLEVHAELNTESKIYCSCKNAFGLEVNSQCCPICMGMPGTLPTLNMQVVEYAIKMGHALHCNIHRICKQDRKNYFYPDLPKSYQISQFDIPLCETGYLDVLVENPDKSTYQKRFGVTRIHIEEDAGKLLHSANIDGSLVDFNRCGVPLIEIVSEPDFRSSAEAHAYLETIKSILQYLDISDCKMEQGSIRADVNVSVRKKGSKEFGTRVEMKNVNSFSAVVRAIDYEAARQIEVLENGGEIFQETRRWDDAKGENVLLRSKEDSQDYRYFPEPDLPTIVLEQEYVDGIKESIPELPNIKLIRFTQDFGISYDEAQVLLEEPEKCAFFEESVAKKVCSPKIICNWMVGDLTKYLREKKLGLGDTALTVDAFTALLKMIEEGKISNAAGKQVFEVLLTQEHADPAKIVEEKGLAQISDDSALQAVVNQVCEANQKSIQDYKNGKTNALGYLTGQCMKATKGKGNPAKMKELLLEYLQTH